MTIPTDSARERQLLSVIEQMTLALIAYADAATAALIRERAVPSLWPPAPTDEYCDVSATMCLRHEPRDEDRDCPWDGHDHPRCLLARGHQGRHSWQDEDDNRPTMDPHATPPARFSIPLAPPVGRSVFCVGAPELRWTLETGGDGSPVATRRTDEDTIECVSWHGLLAMYGELELADLTPAETASEALYGPIGARWGDPTQPCPYGGCARGWGHAEYHRDAEGNVLGLDAYLDGSPNVTPGRSLVCNCGRPDQHRPTCNRYSRRRSTIIDGSDDGGPIDPWEGVHPRTPLDEEPPF